MSADYNGTDKSKCSGRRRASRSNFVKGRWPGWAVPTAPRSPRESPRSPPLPGAALRRAPATPGAGFCVYFLLNDWSSCCSIPREMLNIPAWNIWEFSWSLIQITENREKRQLIFSTDGLFSVSKIISFVWRNPWENAVELGDFLPVFSLQEGKFGGISEQRKGKEENWGQGMWPNQH